MTYRCEQRRREHIEVGWTYGYSATDPHPMRLIEWDQTTGTCLVEWWRGRRFFMREGRLRQFHARPPEGE